jgi:hypothetical protein
MIYCVLQHNNNHRMNQKTYRLDEEMIADHVEPYPVDIWHWGMENRVGHLHTMEPDKIRLNLLPSTQASVTRRGIIFEGMRYSCKRAVEEQWFVKAGEKGSWPISIAYDPRNTNLVYLRLENGQRSEQCSLLDTERVFKEHDLQDMQDYFSCQKQAELAALSRDQQSQAVFHAQMQSVINEAQEKAKAIPTEQSKRSKIANIRQNRREEQERLNAKESWELSPEMATSSPAKTEDLSETREPETSERRYIGPPQPIERLRKLREARRGNEQ